MADVFETDMFNIELSKLVISKPKKTDDSLFGKITYNDCQVHLHFYNIDIIKHKRIKQLTKYYSVIFMKIPKSLCQQMIEFDNHCIEQVKSNIGGWFSKTLDENVIEEYYTTSVIINNNEGFMLKLKLQGTSEDMLEPQKVDVVIALKGLRFYKQRFIPEWEIVNIKPVYDDFINSIQSDDENNIWQEEIDENDSYLPEPDEEELTCIYNTLFNKMEKKYKTLVKKQQKYTDLSEHISSLIERLESNKHNLSVLENIDNLFDELFSVND